MRKIKFNNALLLLFLGLLAYSCGPKTVATKTKYSEDLSAYRPEINHVDIAQIKAPSPDKSNKKENETTYSYAPPENDITKELRGQLDSIAMDNQNKPVIIYTIQVYSGPNRDQANQVRQKMYHVTPELTSSMGYDQPNYKVKVGSYYDRIMAYETLSKLKKYFPSALLVPERKYIN